MQKCQHCESRNVEWFTPTRYAARAAVLLCMVCHRLTIMPPHPSHTAQESAVGRAA